MDSYDSESRRILQLFQDLQDPPAFAPLQFQDSVKFVKLFAKLNIEYSIFYIVSLNFAVLKPNFDEISSEFRHHFQKMIKSVERVMR